MYVICTRASSVSSQWSSALTFALLNCEAFCSVLSQMTPHVLSVLQLSCLSGCTSQLRITTVGWASTCVVFTFAHAPSVISVFMCAAKGIEVELITEAGESYAEATPAVEAEPELRSEFDLELTAVASASAHYGAAKATEDYYGSFARGSLQSGLLQDSDRDATAEHADHSVSAKAIMPALLRCGVKEHTCSVVVFVVSSVIAVATLAMQALNPTSVASS